MEKGDIVTIKEETFDPNFPDLSIGGFKAKVIVYEPEGKTRLERETVFVQFIDLPKKYREEVKRRGIENEVAGLMWLNVSCILDPTAPQVAGYWVNVKDRLPPPSTGDSRKFSNWLPVWTNVGSIIGAYNTKDNVWIDWFNQDEIDVIWWLDVTPPPEVQP